MSKTPLVDSLKTLKHARYHMPGHKGIMPENFPNPFEIDFTEISKTGNLYLADGPIFDSEKIYAKYFGAKEIIYLTGGSTQGIMTAIFSAKPKKILCDRNSHKALCNALGLMDLTPEFISPEINTEFAIPSVISPEKLREKLENDTEIDVVFITSPNYYGIYSDIKEISQICHKNDAILIVDEAHGCHFNAIGIKNAVSCGADITVTSAHKTTDSLGQGAVLMTNLTDINLRKNASIFGTSSPSYLIMSSIEIALSNIDKYSDFEKIHKLRNSLISDTKFKLLNVENIDFYRVVLNCSEFELNAIKIAEILENKYNIVPEMADIYNIVLIITPRDSRLDELLACLVEISEKLDKNPYKTPFLIEGHDVKREVSIRNAMFSDNFTVNLRGAVGEISAEIIAPYPPGVPIVFPGEIILKSHVEYMEKVCYNSNIKVNILRK